MIFVASRNSRSFKNLMSASEITADNTINSKAPPKAFIGIKINKFALAPPKPH